MSPSRHVHRLRPRRALLIGAVLVIAALAGACSTPRPDLEDGLYAQILTNRGGIIVRLEPEKAPLTVMNFVGLAEGVLENTHTDGEPFYDGLTFHRVEPDFVVQGGDPAGNGSGGPGYRFPTETHPDLRHDQPGVVAMANSGPDTNGSQFYITMAATPHLDGGYNVFGEVVQGMDVVTSLEVGDRMREVNILRYGAEASEYEATQQQFDRLVERVYEAREQEAARRREEALEAARERWPGLTQYEDTNLLLATLEEGSGTEPREGDTVRVHIVFSLLDGTQLDSTVDRGEPEEYTYLSDRIIPGLELAVGTLTTGERLVAVVPPELAFGEAGLPPAVPPNSYVVFELERIE